MISILAVNYWADDFRDLLVRSIKENAKGEYEILIHDNGINNIGHGKGLDELVKQANGEYCLVVDIDTHFLMEGFDKKLIEHFEKNDFDLLGAEGSLLKPMRPCTMMFRTKFFKDNKMSFTAREYDGVKLDVGQYFYFKTLSLGKKIGFLGYEQAFYKNVLGNNYTLGGRNFIYHNWWGTRWFNREGERVHDKIDNITWEEFSTKKQNLWNQLPQ